MLATATLAPQSQTIVLATAALAPRSLSLVLATAALEHISDHPPPCTAQIEKPELVRSCFVISREIWYPRVPMST